MPVLRAHADFSDSNVVRLHKETLPGGEYIMTTACNGHGPRQNEPQQAGTPLPQMPSGGFIIKVQVRTPLRQHAPMCLCSSPVLLA